MENTIAKSLFLGLSLVVIVLCGSGMVFAQPENLDRRSFLEEIVKLEGKKTKDEIAQHLIEQFKNNEVPWKHLWHLGLRWQLFGQGTEEAISLYTAITDRHSFEDDSDIVVVHSSLAEALINAGRPQQAVKHLLNTREGRNATTFERAALGQSYLAIQEYQKAHYECSAALALYTTLTDPCWRVLSIAGKIMFQGERIKYLATAQNKHSEEQLIEVEGVLIHGIPEHWNTEKYCAASQDYRTVIQNFENAGIPAYSTVIRRNFLARGLELVRENLSAGKADALLRLAYCVESVSPIESLSPAQRALMHYSLARAHLLSKEYRSAVNAIDVLSMSQTELLLERNEDGQVERDLALSLLKSVLWKTWFNISWPENSNYPRSLDILDFTGHLFAVEGNQEAVDARELVKFIVQDEGNSSDSSSLDLSKTFFMKPYGSVSREEDRATMGACQDYSSFSQATKKTEENGATAFFCAGIVAFPSFLKGGPKLPDQHDLDALIQYALDQGDLELATKDALWRVINSFTKKNIDEKIDFPGISYRLATIEATASKYRNLKINRETMEAIIISKTALEILRKRLEKPEK